MKKIAIIGLILVMLCAVISFAQPRIDLGIDVPFLFGINFSGSGGSNVSAFSQFTALLPEFAIHYVIDLELIKIGLGVRMFTFIIESIGWPNAFVEVNLDPLVLSAELGGGLYFLFGLYNTAGTMPLLLGDISAAFKFTDWFRIGIGVFTIGEGDPAIAFSDEGVLPYAVYAFAKFSFDLGPKTNN
jgi:hypothetical protein